MRCKTVRTEGLSEGDNLYAFQSTLLSPLPTQLKPCFTGLERIRLRLRSLSGKYILYYIFGKERLAGYCFLKRGYLKRYSFLQKGDMLINPYYVAPPCRRNHYATIMLHAATADRDTAWRRLWAVVASDNHASAAALRKVGFQQVGFAEKTHWAYHLTMKPSRLTVFRIDRGLSD